MLTLQFSYFKQLKKIPCSNRTVWSIGLQLWGLDTHSLHTPSVTICRASMGQVLIAFWWLTLISILQWRAGIHELMRKSRYSSWALTRNEIEKNIDKKYYDWRVKFPFPSQGLKTGSWPLPWRYHKNLNIFDHLDLYTKMKSNNASVCSACYLSLCKR